MIKVLIVDDSAFVRKVIREMIGADNEIEVIGVARNGADALEMLESANPDVVTCDLIMPEMDGVEFVKKQMAQKPLPILIVTASPQDAEHVLDALEAGAVDFIQKPSALASDNLRTLGGELIEKIKAASLSKSKVFAAPAKVVPATIPKRAAATSRFDIVVLGISTGGPQALRYLLPQLATDFPVPLVMVLHLPVGYTAAFAEKLDELSQLDVKEAAQGDVPRGGQALLAPAGKHLKFHRTHDGKIEVRLTLQPENKREGSSWIKSQGGMILTESEASCIIYGMPRSVVEAGLSDGAISLSSMAGEISKRL
jgi:two-component system chemotaxis response regulator CheB